MKNQDSANSEGMFRLRCASLNMTTAFLKHIPHVQIHILPSPTPRTPLFKLDVTGFDAGDC